MGKASRKKHQLRLEKATLQKYGHVKLSDAISHLCEPFEDDQFGIDGYRNLIGITVTAWNIALISSFEERKKMLLSVLETLPKTHNLTRESSPGFNPADEESSPDAGIMIQILAELISRKEDLYPNDDRLIVDYILKPTANGYHLQIKSIIPKRVDD